MNPRGAMIHRAVVERNSASGTDGYGQPVAPVFVAHATLACFVWSQSRRIVTDGRKSAYVEDHRAMFPLSADIQESDELASIVDRQDETILTGRFRIDGIQRKHRHLEASLRRVQ